MQATETRTDPAVTIDRNGTYRIDCYVRATVPGPTRKRITAVTDRLQRLDASDVIADYRVRQWPPERHVAEVCETTAPQRRELVAAFERWARQHGYSLEPAFRRRELPSWPLGRESAETCERVRVPVVALALYDESAEPATESGSESDSSPDTESLEGVVPYSEPSSTGERRTYTVGEWLEAVESEWRESVARTAESDLDSDSVFGPESEHRSILGGQRHR